MGIFPNRGEPEKYLKPQPALIADSMCLMQVLILYIFREAVDD